MENNLNFCWRWKTTSIFLEIDNDVHHYGNGRGHVYFQEDDLIVFQKWKTTPIFKEMEGNYNFFLEIEDDLYFLEMEDNLHVR